MKLDRRKFLTRAGLGAVAAGAAGTGLAREATPAAAKGAKENPAKAPLLSDGPPGVPTVADPGATLPPVPFHGEHQAGIVTPKPASGKFASFDVMAANRGELVDLLKTLTRTARFLTTGGTPPILNADEPPSDSGTLGPVVPADGLTITVAFGASMFDHRFGLAGRKPVRLTDMQPFPNDELDPAQTGGDLLVQITAGSDDVAVHALRTITRHTRGAMQLNWRIDGFAAPSRPSGVPRNHFGFKDGIANPDVQDPAVASRLLWVTHGIGEPAWATGGSYLVVRIIKQLVEFWDRVSLNEQQTMIGRFRGSGAPLDGIAEDEVPDYRSDPRGNVIPLTAHIRVANPRTPASEDSRIYRRGFNYDRGVDPNGNLDIGLIFTCFQQDLKRQFIATQTRLIGEPMTDYITPVGGGYFFALPGVRDRADWYASRLLA